MIDEPENEADADAEEPDWDTPVALKLSPAVIAHALFQSADSVHTGWSSCIDHSLIVADATAIDEQSENHCRLVEQEYVEDDAPEVTWHDWAVEVRLAATFVTAHWRAETSSTPVDWEWCRKEAEDAFSRACLLVGRRVRRGLVIDEAADPPKSRRTHH